MIPYPAMVNLMVSPLTSNDPRAYDDAAAIIIDRGSRWGMIRMSELLEDPVYRKYLLTKPEMPKHLRDPRVMKTPPWVVYIQKEAGGSWGRKSFWKYKEAVKFLNKAINHYGVYDAALNNKRIGYDPPAKIVRVRGKYVIGSDGVKRQKTKFIAWIPKLAAGEDEHHWCRHCRRPTIFKFYVKHKNLGACTSGVPRCCICGASTRIAISAGDRLYQRF